MRWFYPINQANLNACVRTQMGKLQFRVLNMAAIDRVRRTRADITISVTTKAVSARAHTTKHFIYFLYSINVIGTRRDQRAVVLSWVFLECSESGVCMCLCCAICSIIESMTSNTTVFAYVCESVSVFVCFGTYLNTYRMPASHLSSPKRCTDKRILPE